ncbi:MAG TPA: hypothetical protein VJB06_03535, partial [archaeon]|nr:hypothetical protein [archaeon]
FHGLKKATFKENHACLVATPTEIQQMPAAKNRTRARTEDIMMFASVTPGWPNFKFEIISEPSKSSTPPRTQTPTSLAEVIV